MRNMRDMRGITLITLVVTIIIMLILAGITIYSSKDAIENAKLNELKTNMLLIQAKAREYVEDANFKMGINPDDSRKTEVRKQVYEEGANLLNADVSELASFGIEDASTCYWLTEEAKNNWGLDKIQLKSDERYLIQFDEENVTVEIYNTKGYEGKYRLTDIDLMQ